MAFSRIVFFAATGSVAFVTTAITTYASVVYSRTSAIKKRQIIVLDSAPNSFNESNTMRKLVNPRHHETWSDTHLATLELSCHQHITDEALLSRVIKEFYSGWVFAPERWILRLLGKQLVRLTPLTSTPISSPIWDPDELSTSKLPPLHSVLFGTWQVVDISLATRADHAGEAESYIDLAYGSDSWQFVGCNRFSIQHVDSDDGDTDGHRQVRVIYAQSNCNPVENKPPVSAALLAFHKAYAMLLYREVMSGLMRWLDTLQEPQLQGSFAKQR
ncbi:hypothetical protein HJFPF1_05257 [Paramyrothecium foliicola]|nr:hypothetical protein HJFPF1_05257 [Paramyrothecium foliicola]